MDLVVFLCVALARESPTAHITPVLCCEFFSRLCLNVKVLVSDFIKPELLWPTLFFQKAQEMLLRMYVKKTDHDTL